MLEKQNIVINNLEPKNKKVIIKIITGSQIKRKLANKLRKSINGNIQGFKIMNWNKTDRPLEEKINAIKQILIEHKPHILFVNELNLIATNYSGITNNPGYNFECDKLLLANNTARTGVWISNKIQYNRLNNFDDGINSIIALEVCFPTKKSLQ